MDDLDDVQEQLEELKRTRQALDDAIAALEQIARARYPALYGEKKKPVGRAAGR